jgi:hypothetical protein
MELRKKETKPTFFKNNYQEQPTTKESRMIDSLGQRPIQQSIQCWGCKRDHMYKYFSHMSEKVNTSDTTQQEET